MDEKINLKEIEKKSFKSFFGTGIHDIGFGILLLTIAIAPLIRESFGYWYIAVIIIPSPLVISLGMRYIGNARIGKVKFGVKRKSSAKMIKKITLVSTTLLIALVVLTFSGIFPGQIVTFLGGGAMFMLTIAIVVFVFMGVLAYIMDFSNLILYGLVIGIGITTAEILRGIIGAPLDSLLTFGILGSLLTIYGIINLSRFMKKYPKPEG